MNRSARTDPATGVLWRPSLGAVPEDQGTWFRVWAPRARMLELVLERAAEGTAKVPLDPTGDGYHEVRVPGVRPGDRYRFTIDGRGPFPDPASRFQPEGVHGPSEVVHPHTFPWSDHEWGGVPLAELILYELHVGTYTEAGTFAAVTERLPILAELGVTAIELMPVADFPGNRNWGYDGGALFAPSRRYGTPDDLRRMVDTAHRLGLAVHLDVVYNHFGPDGAYAPAFSPLFFTSRHRSPWGDGINLDDEGSAQARSFFIENALHWIHEYHLDGLRLDATHAMVDDSPRHFLAELSERVRSTVSDREVLLVAEDARNLAHMVKPVASGGWSMDAVWSDDFHHQMRCLLAGDRGGYFMDFSGTVADLATTVRQGWFYTGQHAAYFEGARGTDPTGVSPERFVFFIQNHDQVGNRAFGERLHHQIPLEAYRAASALLLVAPQTPLLFMGQEWACGSAFRFFTDHDEALGRRVTEGRRQEFHRFPEFSSPEARDRIPDPQALATFLDSRLRWGERANEPHASMLRLYRKLLALRRTWTRGLDTFEIQALDSGTLALRRDGPAGKMLLAVVRLRGAGEVTVAAALAGVSQRDGWRQELTTEDREFSSDPRPPLWEPVAEGLCVRFLGPAALVLVAG